MIDEFLTLAEEVRQLREENKKLRLDKHVLQVKINWMCQELKRKEVEDIKVPDFDSMWSQPLDTYVCMVKTARESCGYSHETWIWRVLSDLENDLIRFKEIGELYYKQKENEDKITEETS